MYEPAPEVVGCAVRGSLAEHMRKAANRRRKGKSRRRHTAGRARSTSARTNGTRLRSSPAIHRFKFSGFKARGLGGFLPRLASSTRSGVHWLAQAPASVVRTLALTPEDREIAALLLAPFFFVAFLMAGHQGVQLARQLQTRVAIQVPPSSLTTHAGPQNVATSLSAQHVHSKNAPVPLIGLSHAGPASNARLASGAMLTIHSKVDNRQVPARAFAPLSHDAVSDATAWWSANAARSMTVVSNGSTPPPPLHVSVDATRPEPVATIGNTHWANVTSVPEQLNVELRVAAVSTTAVSQLDADDIDTITAYVSPFSFPGSPRGLFERCSLPTTARNATARPPRPPLEATWFGETSATKFGVRLAEAARRQLNEFVIYDAAYQRISYPRGDVPKLYGVCSDVIVRAYRDMGIDLQEAVQKARVGSGDANIDHRRTETLRRFFSLFGERLPVTSFSEDYLPGDIVTYARPQNIGPASRSHIAIVSDVMAPSGRPLILHNRGWGPQLEDALFVDRITGHYRYQGPASVKSVDNIRPLEARPLKTKRHIKSTAIPMPSRPTLLPRSQRRAHLNRTPKKHARGLQVGSSSN